MMTIDKLPMWLSLAAIVFGIFLSALLIRLARGGVLLGFTVLLTAGMAVFGIHHLAEMELSRDRLFISAGLEAVSSLAFLGAAVYLGYRLRKILGAK